MFICLFSVIFDFFLIFFSLVLSFKFFLMAFLSKIRNFSFPSRKGRSSNMIWSSDIRDNHPTSWGMLVYVRVVA